MARLAAVCWPLMSAADGGYRWLLALQVVCCNLRGDLLTSVAAAGRDWQQRTLEQERSSMMGVMPHAVLRFSATLSSLPFRCCCQVLEQGLLGQLEKLAARLAQYSPAVAAATAPPSSSPAIDRCAPCAANSTPPGEATGRAAGHSSSSEASIDTPASQLREAAAQYTLAARQLQLADQHGSARCAQMANGGRALAAPPSVSGASCVIGCEWANTVLPAASRTHWFEHVFRPSQINRPADASGSPI